MQRCSLVQCTTYCVYDYEFVVDIIAVIADLSFISNIVAMENEYPLIKLYKIIVERGRR